MNVAMSVPVAAEGRWGDEGIEARLESSQLVRFVGRSGDPASQFFNLLLDGDYACFANEWLVHTKL